MDPEDTSFCEYFNANENSDEISDEEKNDDAADANEEAEEGDESNQKNTIDKNIDEAKHKKLLLNLMEKDLQLVPSYRRSAN